MPYLCCICNVDRYLFKQTHINRGLDTKHIKENMVIYKKYIQKDKKKIKNPLNEYKIIYIIY